MPPLQPNTLDRTRTAMKFSLWAWAAYWPSMGIMLLLGGMGDPVSVAVALGSAAAFGLLALGGALRATSSSTMREFLIERPFYLVAALIVFLALGSAFPFMADLGLALFSGTYLAGLLLVGYRLVQHVNATGQGVFRAGADQVLLLLLFAVPAAFMVLVDALAPGGGGLGNPPTTVAIVNWMCLAFPALLLIASRPLREPLQLLRRSKKTTPAPVPTAAAQSAE